MLNERQRAIQRRRKRQKPEWKYDPANPNMVVGTRLLMVQPWGIEKVEVELDPREMSRIARESLEDAEFTKPSWNQDPLYYAARRLRKARRARP